MPHRHHEASAIRAHCADVFALDTRLPGMVFLKDRGDTLFGEFDALLTPELWPALCAMARWHGDQHVELIVLSASHGTTSAPAALSLSVEASSDDYWDAVGFAADGDALDSITVAANVVAVTGPSGKWGCWGERDPEVAVFQGFPDTAARDAWRAEFGPFLGVDEALASYLSLAFRSPVPDWYNAAMTAHYRVSSDSRA
ncbi:hypothetical protein ACIBCO_39080 [Streptomyces violascens]|uniref:hypothetical protein n=1 Tax=Streptomyces violascens TaxID=67381 RepID=UPI0037B27D8C